MPAAVEAAVAQADVAEGGLQPAASGDSQQRGSTPDATADAGDAADSGLSKSGRKAPSKGTRKLPAGQAVDANNSRRSATANNVCFFAEAVQQLLAVRDELEAAGTPLGAGRTAKAWATHHILQRCQKRGEKLVIFCQYLTDLNDIEAGLKQVCVRMNSCETSRLG
ncbi:hypothetical protein MMC16_007782 [Acarospora aff. strigata]|nr:hypothetical protein [Acarospora aff. strigata]